MKKIRKKELKNGNISARNCGQVIVERQQHHKREEKSKGRQHVPNIVFVVKVEEKALAIAFPRHSGADFPV